MSTLVFSIEVSVPKLVRCMIVVKFIVRSPMSARLSSELLKLSSSEPSANN